MDPDHWLRQVHSQHLETVSVVLKYPTSHWSHAVAVAPVGHVAPIQKLPHGIICIYLRQKLLFLLACGSKRPKDKSKLIPP